MAWDWILYVNAYEVTQAYGGSEEGGWWYDIGMPLASIPIRAKLREVPGCRCETSAFGQAIACANVVHECAPHFTDCEAKCEPCGCACHDRALEPDERPGEVSWLDAQVRLQRASLNHEDPAQRRGRTSAAGGYDIQIRVEPEVATPYPLTRPRYE